MPPDFLNSREDALAVWALVALGFILYGRSTRNAFVHLLRASIRARLLLLFGSVFLYSAAIVYVASTIGVWHTAALKETILWFLGSGLVLVGGAVSFGKVDLGQVLRRVAALTILIEFAANLYAFPLAVELVVALVALVFVALQAYLPYHPEPVARGLRAFINSVVAAIGVVYLSYFLVRAISDLGAFLSRQNAEALLVGPVLTLCLIPLLVAWARFSRREQRNLRKRWRAGLNSPA